MRMPLDGALRGANPSFNSFAIGDVPRAVRLSVMATIPDRTALMPNYRRNSFRFVTSRGCNWLARPPDPAPEPRKPDGYSLLTLPARISTTLPCRGHFDGRSD